jgi:GTPase
MVYLAILGIFLKASQEHFIDRHRGGERAILVQMDMQQLAFAQDLTEFQALADAAAVKALGVISGKLNQPHAKFFVGSGKAEEIARQVGLLQAEVVLFNHPLTAAQGRNLEKLLNCRVLDRTELILDIFAQRARTFEGKLQVELAQLQHLRSRLVRGWTHLERQKGGIGLRGPGETQLETDRRLINVKIQSVKKRLLKVMGQRHQGQSARRRAAIPVVSLAGYTNAGKSTLFNRLTRADVYVANQLFATLDPTHRQIQLPPLGSVIMADTVGFIRDLPHDLIAAFRATLEETRQADLLLHVIDASSSQHQQNIADVETVLHEIDADQVPRLRVYNKIDLRPDFTPRITRDSEGRPIEVWLSAQTGEGIELLLGTLSELLSVQVVYREVSLSPQQGKLRASLYNMGVVVNETIDESGYFQLRLRIQQSDYLRLFAEE